MSKHSCTQQVQVQRCFGVDLGHTVPGSTNSDSCELVVAIPTSSIDGDFIFK